MKTAGILSEKSRSPISENNKSGKNTIGKSIYSFADNRPETVSQRKLQKIVNSAESVNSVAQLYSSVKSSVQKKEVEEEELVQGKFNPVQLQEVEEEEPLQGKFETVQKMEEEEELLQGKFEAVQNKGNKTGLPDNLKSGVENLSGHSLDDVKVHYNSDKPGQLQAHAYAQGTDIHVAPGQEKHLPHEAWHVVQQKQGRVKPTMQMKGNINVNDDAGLEREADVMGAKALEKNSGFVTNNINSGTHQYSAESNTVQRWNIQGGNIDWNQTQAVEPLVARPVLFFDDITGDRIVVKGEDVTIGKTKLANLLHHEIHGTETVYTRDITGDKAAINNIIDDPALSGNHANWAQISVQFPNILPPHYPNLANLTPDEKGRKSREETLNFLPKLQVMDFVPGKTASKLSEVGGNVGGYQTMRFLLSQKAYVERLGKITAVDLFLENDDRVLAGNLGNWMHDQAGNITLIDQLNNNAAALLDDDGNGPNGILGPTVGLNMLANGQINATAVACTNALFHAMQVAGDANVNNWANEHGGAIRNRIVLQLETGIRQGVSELRKHLNSKKGRRKGRGIKNASNLFEHQDSLNGNAPQIGFWERLKARARQL